MWRRPLLGLLAATALALAGFGAGVPSPPGQAVATTATVANYDYDHLSTFAQGADRSTLRVTAFHSGFAPFRTVGQSGVAAKSAPAVVRGGESAAAAYGREVHAAYDYGPGFVKEFRDLPSGARPDAVNLVTREVVELKPNTPAAIRRGEAQLRRYAAE